LQEFLQVAKPLPHEEKDGTLNGSNIPYASDHEHESNNLANSDKAGEKNNKDVREVHVCTPSHKNAFDHGIKVKRYRSICSATSLSSVSSP